MSDDTTTDEIKEHVKDSSVWTRLLFMLLFAALYWAAEVVLTVVVVFQFFSVLLTGNRNEKVLALGAQLSTYAYQVFRFLTYNSEEKPFPMGEWPSDAELGEAAVAAAAEKKPAAKRAPAKKRASASKAKTTDEKPAASD